MAPAPGVTPPPQDGSCYRFLSDVIMARGFVEPDAMKAALQASLAGRSLTELLVERGSIAEIDLARSIAEHHRLDHVDLDAFPVEREAATLVEAAIARRLGAIPIAALSDGGVVVALHDPNDLSALREIGQLTDHAIQPAVASRSQVAALIDALHPSSAPPVLAADATAPEKHVRAVPANDMPVASSHPADVLRPTAPAPIQMQTRNENEERAGATEERAGAAEERAGAAEERARIAQARAQAAEERALKAENTIAGANARTEGLMAAATAANEALARLVGNCELLEREATAREGEMHALRSELESERAERVRLEQHLLAPPASEELLALHVRIAELERELDEERASAARAQAPPAATYLPPVTGTYLPQPAGHDAPAPAEARGPVPAEAFSPAPAEAFEPAPAEACAPAPAETFSPAPAEAFEPAPAEAFQPAPAEACAPAPAEAFAPAPGEADVSQPAPAPGPVAEAPVVDQPPAAAPRPTLTIDILGEPGVPYVSALAPMPPVGDPAAAKPKNSKSAAKARGLRRLIGALKRG
ncbi:MAG TPA: hypothetical protein VGO80_03170 [Solirubrobacteraceae bacterium]|nr:hypothetical protein [Solirubrobacteraceae bacterium]